jgi:hypothetical protein
MLSLVPKATTKFTIFMVYCADGRDVQLLFVWEPMVYMKGNLKLWVQVVRANNAGLRGLHNSQYILGTL